MGDSEANKEIAVGIVARVGEKVLAAQAASEIKLTERLQRCCIQHQRQPCVFVFVTMRACVRASVRAHGHGRKHFRRRI